MRIDHGLKLEGDKLIITLPLEDGKKPSEVVVNGKIYAPQEKAQLSGEDATKDELSQLVRKKKVYNAVSNAIAPYIPLLNGKTEEIPLKCARAIMWLPPEQPPKYFGYRIDDLAEFAMACRVEGIEEGDLRNFVLNRDHIYRMIEKSVRKSLNTVNTLGALNEALPIGGDEK